MVRDSSVFMYATQSTSNRTLQWPDGGIAALLLEILGYSVTV